MKNINEIRKATPEASKQGRAALRRVTEQLLAFLDSGAPDILIARQMVLLLDSSALACGDQLFVEFGRHMLETARRHYGLCQHCDNPIVPALTHDPICKACDARLDKEVDRMTKEAGL